MKALVAKSTDLLLLGNAPRSTFLEIMEDCKQFAAGTIVIKNKHASGGSMVQAIAQPAERKGHVLIVHYINDTREGLALSNVWCRVLKSGEEFTVTIV